MGKTNQPRAAESCLDVQVYLASASPRRQQLLQSVGLQFEVIAADIDETHRVGEAPDCFVQRVAEQKAQQVAAQLARQNRAVHPVVAADTCVVIQDQVLGKPRHRDHAVQMLRRLSGRSHEVLTAVVVHRGDDILSAVSRSRVKFKTLSDNEIARYCRTSEPLDKAGAYAIQGLACGFVEYLEGSYTGVVGLPMFELRQLLIHAGIDWI